MFHLLPESLSEQFLSAYFVCCCCAMNRQAYSCNNNATIVVVASPMRTLWGSPTMCNYCTLINAFRRVRCGCFCIIPLHGQPHAVFRGCISISRGWMLSCKELIVAKDSPHTCSACYFNVVLVFLLMSVWCDTAPSLFDFIFHKFSLNSSAVM